MAWAEHSEGLASWQDEQDMLEFEGIWKRVSQHILCELTWEGEERKLENVKKKKKKSKT